MLPAYAKAMCELLTLGVRSSRVPPTGSSVYTTTPFACRTGACARPVDGWTAERAANALTESVCARGRTGNVGIGLGAEIRTNMRVVAAIFQTSPPPIE